jgi:protein gp37
MMAENSGIEWTHHTFNPWIGCTKVSAACDHCYAEAWDKRGLQGGALRWGPHADRTLTKTWGNPVKWNKQAAILGERQRVFCASLADIADNHKSIQSVWRRGLVHVIRACPSLDFLLLSKRPQNVAKLYPDLIEDWPDNVWMGASTENREEMLRRGEALAKLPAKITFWSAEPLVGDLGEMPEWFRAFVREIATSNVMHLNETADAAWSELVTLTMQPVQWNMPDWEDLPKNEFGNFRIMENNPHTRSVIDEDTYVMLRNKILSMNEETP